jgi:hypothetical protein
MMQTMATMTATAALALAPTMIPTIRLTDWLTELNE